MPSSTQAEEWFDRVKTVQALAMVRREDGTRAASGIPLRATLVGPRGNVLTTRSLATNDGGLLALDFDLSHDQPTGSYRVDLSLGTRGRRIGTTSIRCACVVPETLRPSISLKRDVLHPGDEINLLLAATTLTGEPAKNRRAIVRARLSPRSAMPFEGFRFGEDHVELTATTLDVGRVQLDAQGKGVLTFKVPELRVGSRPWQAGFEVEVVDHSGRAAFAHVVRPIQQAGARLGIAVSSAESEHAVRVEIMARDAPDALPATGQLLVEEVTRQGRYVRRHARWVWQSTESTAEIVRVPFDITSGITSQEVELPGDGRYRIRATASGMLSTSQTGSLFHGGFRVETKSDTDVHVPLQVVGEHAEAGEPVELELDAPFAGAALLSLETRGVLHAEVRTLKKGLQRLRVIVPESASKTNGVYATISLVRGAREDAAGVLPHRLLGACYVPIQRAEQVLETTLGIEGTPQPEKPLVVQVETSRPAQVRVFVVDEGLLRLTDHPAPESLAYLRAREALRTTPFDSYTRLIERMDFDSSEATQGGDALDVAPRLSSGAEKTMETLALASDVISCSGQTSLTFDLPSYEGRVRVVAVAADELGVGSASSYAIVRAPISMRMHLPRVVAPGDTFVVPLEIAGDGVATDTTTHEVEVEGLDIVARKPELTLRAQSGRHVARISVTARSAKGTTRTLSRRLAIRPPVPYQTQTRVIALRGKTDVSLPGRWHKRGRRVTLRVGSSSALAMVPALEVLHRYPYGCVEQTTSRAFPLLAWRELLDAHDPEGARSGGGSSASVVKAAISRLATMQTPSGGFSMWPGGREAYPFGSAYATEYLTAAASKGFRVAGRNAEARRELRRRSTSRRKGECIRRLCGADWGTQRAILSRRAKESCRRCRGPGPLGVHLRAPWRTRRCAVHA